MIIYNCKTTYGSLWTFFEYDDGTYAVQSGDDLNQHLKPDQGPWPIRKPGVWPPKKGAATKFVSPWEEGPEDHPRRFTNGHYATSIMTTIEVVSDE